MLDKNYIFNYFYNWGKFAELTTSKDTARLATISYYRDISTSSGASGKMFELFIAPPYSSKTAVSAQGDLDNTIRLTRNGKTGNYKAEAKSNGGRIGTILDCTSDFDFVVYSYFVQDKTGMIEICQPKIFRVSTFINILKATNAIKPVYHDGILEDYAIQNTGKFRRLIDKLGTNYDRLGSTDYDKIK